MCGFSFEAAQFAHCLVAGETESPLLPHATTLRVMETMDDVRRQVGPSVPANDAGPGGALAAGSPADLGLDRCHPPGATCPEAESSAAPIVERCGEEPLTCRDGR